MAAKKQKLEAQFSSNIQREQDKSSTSSGIFEGVTIHVNGYTGTCVLHQKVVHGKLINSKIPHWSFV